MPPPKKRPERTVLLWIASLLAALSAASFAAADTVSVMVVGEVPAEGRSLIRPDPKAPVFCLVNREPYRNGHFDFLRQKIPTGEAVMRLVGQSLAAQGYLPATNAAPPCLILTVSWGITVPKFVRRQPVNAQQMLSILGGTVFDAINPLGTNNARLMVDATHPRSFIVITAYSFAAWQKRQVREVVWRTHVSTPRKDHPFEEVLPMLLAEAGPVLGRATAEPKLEMVAEKRSLY